MTKSDKNLTVDYTNLVKTYGSSRYERPMVEFRVSYVLVSSTDMNEPTSNMRNLDVATGTGKVALALAGSNTAIVEVDITDSLLQRAQRKTTAAEYPNVRVIKEMPLNCHLGRTSDSG